MPFYRINGQVIEAANPEEAYAQYQAPTDPTEGMSTGERFLAGVGSGMVNVGRQAANLLLPESLEPEWATDEAIARQAEEDRALLDTTAGTVGRFTGDVAATLPLGVGAGAGMARLAGATGRTLPNALRAATEGATEGAILAGPDERLGGAAIGGTIGGVMDPLLRAGGRALGGVPGMRRTDEAQTLLDAGIDLSPGQLHPGGVMSALEESAGARLAPSVQAVREGAKEQVFHRIVNDSLPPPPPSGPIMARTTPDAPPTAAGTDLVVPGGGALVPGRAPGTDLAVPEPVSSTTSRRSPNPGLSPRTADDWAVDGADGEELLTNAYARFNQRYSEFRGHPLPRTPDVIARRMNAALQDVTGDPDTIQRQMRWVDNKIRRGMRDTGDLMAIRSDVRKRAASYRKQGDVAGEDAAELLDAIEDSLTREIEDALPPVLQGEMREVDAAYSRYKVAEEMMFKAGDRPFPTPFQMSQAAKQSAANKGQAARGGGHHRDLTQAAARTFVENTPRTGMSLALPATMTVAGGAVGGMPGAIVGAGLSGALPFALSATRTGRRLMREGTEGLPGAREALERYRRALKATARVGRTGTLQQLLSED